VITICNSFIVNFKYKILLSTDVQMLLIYTNKALNMTTFFPENEEILYF